MLTRTIGPLAMGLAVLVAAGCNGSGSAPSAASVEESLAALPALHSLEDFDHQVLKADKPVLVMVYLHGCDACRRLAPDIVRLSEDYRGKVLFFKADHADSRDLEQRYGIKAPPTVLIASNGRIVASLLGRFPLSKYQGYLDNLVRDPAWLPPRTGTAPPPSAE